MISAVLAGITVPQTAALAPMASVADTAYRTLCREYGACAVTGEMISAKGICYQSRGSAELCRITDAERPMGLQLFGSEPEFFAAAAERLLEERPDWIDLNMGCPVQKVVSQGAGSALMKTPQLAEKIVEATVLAADGRVPVTVKMRLGWDSSSINAVSFAKRMEAAGAAALCIHGRTREQFYHGKADWSYIEKIKQAVSIPVIGSGDIASGADALRRYAETGCDLVMVGRASYGRPWIFQEIACAAEGKPFSPPSLEERLSVMLRHIRMMLKSSEQPESQVMHAARKHAMWYLHGEPDAASFRRQCAALNSYADAENLAKQYLRQHPANPL